MEYFNGMSEYEENNYEKAKEISEQLIAVSCNTSIETPSIKTIDREYIMSLKERDFSDNELRDFTLRKEIIFESSDKNEVNQKEIEFIVQYNKSNDSCVGYNRHPKYRAR